MQLLPVQQRACGSVQLQAAAGGAHQEAAVALLSCVVLKPMHQHKQRESTFPHRDSFQLRQSAAVHLIHVETHDWMRLELSV